jgi:hypothetical protein
MRIYLHGNCQMPAMASLLRELMAGWTIDVTDVSLAHLDRDEASVHSAVRRADVIVAQPVSPGYRGVAWLGSDFLKAQARAGATLLIMPSIFFRGHTPDWFYLGPPGGRLVVQGLPYHNVVVADAVLRNCPTAQIVDRVTSVLAFDRHFVEGQIARSLAELRMREANESVDLTVSDLIADAHFDRPVMATIDHPGRALLAQVANRALALLSEGRRVAEAGPGVLDDYVLPTTPAVGAWLGHRLADSVNMAVAGRPVAVADYLAGAIAEYRAMDPAHLAALLFGNPQARGFLAALSRHDRDRHQYETETATSLIRGLYEVLLDRSPGPREILSHLRTATAEGGRQVISNFLASNEFKKQRARFIATLGD